MLIWYNGQVTLNGNREKGAVYTFSKANVLMELLLIQEVFKI